MGLTRVWRLAAFAWGFAEATLFFTVPDVLLTLAAVRLGWWAALRLLLITLIGALLGGSMMYGLGAHDLETARATVDSVPLISADMIASAGESMRGNWFWAMIIGAMTGTPYKIYAVEAAAAGVPFVTFVLASVLARSVRWILTLTFAALVAAALVRMGLSRWAVPLWAVLWVAFYLFYYVVMSL